MAERPRVTESTRRKHLVAFRLTDEERRLWELWAETDDLPLADFIRRLVNEYILRRE